MKKLLSLMLIVLASVSTGWSHNSYAEAEDFSGEAEMYDDLQEMILVSYQEYPNTKPVAEALVQNKSLTVNGLGLAEFNGNSSVANCLKDFTCHIAIVSSVWWQDNRVRLNMSGPRIEGNKLKTDGCIKSIQQVDPYIIYVARPDNNYDIRNILIALNGGDDKWIFDPKVSLCE